MDSTGPDIPDIEVGARIAAARRQAGIPQHALAAAVGVSRSAVAQWETGRAGQLRGNLSRIAAVLGVSTAFLMEGAAAAETSAENATELALLRLYRTCSEDDRALLLRTARRLAGATPDPEKPHKEI